MPANLLLSKNVKRERVYLAEFLIESVQNYLAQNRSYK